MENQINDGNYEETRTITEIEESNEWYYISTGSLSCGLKKKYGIVPQKGDSLTVHTKNGTFGIIRGMDLNGKRIWWRTDEQLEQDRLDWLEKNEKEKQEKFAANKAEMDADYESLPDCFKTRINRFRANNPRFRIDYEYYELFCCKEALKIAETCKTAEKVKEFQKMDSKEQYSLIPSLSDQHSGNTFGSAIVLAYLYLDSPDNVPKMHGTLSPLVGSEEFGDVPVKNREL